MDRFNCLNNYLETNLIIFDIDKRLKKFPNIISIKSQLGDIYVNIIRALIEDQDVKLFSAPRGNGALSPTSEHLEEERIPISSLVSDV